MDNRKSFSTKKHVLAFSSLRISRIIGEFINGFVFLNKYGKNVSFFGSARAKSNTEYYQEARELARRLSEEGYTVITGGGRGIMEASNRGAYDAGGNSVGLTIELPKESKPNKYVKDSISFHYFFTRKVMLTFASEAYIFFPGGFGTLDEFFEITTLVQTKRIKQIPIVLMHSEYWKPLLSWIEKDVRGKGAFIDAGDTKLYKLVDTVDDALLAIRKP